MLFTSRTQAYEALGDKTHEKREMVEAGGRTTALRYIPPLTHALRGAVLAEEAHVYAPSPAFFKAGAREHWLGKTGRRYLPCGLKRTLRS